MRRIHSIGWVAMLVISGSGMAMTTQPPEVSSPGAFGQTQGEEAQPASSQKTTPERQDAEQEESKANAKQANE